MTYEFSIRGSFMNISILMLLTVVGRYKITARTEYKQDDDKVSGSVIINLYLSSQIKERLKRC